MKLKKKNITAEAERRTEHKVAFSTRVSPDVVTMLKEVAKEIGKPVSVTIEAIVTEAHRAVKRK